jgi:hypothetical protein
MLALGKTGKGHTGTLKYLDNFSVNLKSKVNLELMSRF